MVLKRLIETIVTYGECDFAGLEIINFGPLPLVEDVVVWKRLHLDHCDFERVVVLKEWTRFPL